MQPETIYNTTFIDNYDLLKSIVLAWTLRFDCELDATKLRTSLCELLAIGDWKKLAGRFRKNPDSSLLEIAVPNSFTESEPPIAFSHTKYQLNIDECPAFHCLLAEDEELGTDSKCRKDLDLLGCGKAPRTLDAIISRNHPVLGLYIVTFQNCTFVTVALPHVLMDATGLKDLVFNWSLVLAGRSSEVQPVVKVEDPSMYDVQQANISSNDWALSHLLLGMTDELLVLLRVLWAALSRRTVLYARICISKNKMESLRNEVEADLLRNNKKSLDGKPPWVSDSDILSSFAGKAVAKSYHQPRHINMLTAVNIRRRFPWFSREKVHLQNALCVVQHGIEQGEAELPLAHLALKSRQAVDSTHLQDVFHLMRTEWNSGNNNLPIIGNSKGIFMLYSNWLQNNMYEATDFSSAIVDHGYHGINNGPDARLSMHSIRPFEVEGQFRYLLHTIFVSGRDRAGNIWIDAMVPSNVCDNIRQACADIKEH